MSLLIHLVAIGGLFLSVLKGLPKHVHVRSAPIFDGKTKTKPSTEFTDTTSNTHYTSYYFALGKVIAMETFINGFIRIWLVGDEEKCLLASTPICSKDTIISFWLEYEGSSKSTSYMISLFDENYNLLSDKYISNKQAIMCISRVHQNLMKRCY
ncbi:hypothetical protein L4D76_28290 [Photobacterium sagamiensis]|uniref:hypothetical protein n=1 Tax=Photobacterium sagamiensis TaxID=2910241 RepID=UPI003D0FC467